MGCAHDPRGEGITFGDPHWGRLKAKIAPYPLPRKSFYFHPIRAHVSMALIG